VDKIRYKGLCKEYECEETSGVRVQHGRAVVGGPSEGLQVRLRLIE
jgi:hypothetical protein